MTKEEFETKVRGAVGTSNNYIHTFVPDTTEFKHTIELHFGKGYAISNNASDEKIGEHIQMVTKYLDDDFCDCLARYLEDRGYSVEDVSLRPS